MTKKIEATILILVAIVTIAFSTMYDSIEADGEMVSKLEHINASNSDEIKVKNVKVSFDSKMTAGEKQNVKIKVNTKDADNKAVTITSQNKKVISVKNNQITAKKAGTAKLLVSSDDGGYKKTYTIKVKKGKFFNNVKLAYDEAYKVTSNRLTKSAGVVYYNGHKETYYSQRVLPGNKLNIPGRHVAKDGTVRDKDGYIAVASSYSYKSKGTKIMTSLGPAKVYDTGCPYGVIDIYVNW